MKYVHIDIGNINTPVAGAGYIDVTQYAFFNDGKISEKREGRSLVVRMSYSGNLTFHHLMYDAVRTLISNNQYKVGVRFYDDATLIFEGEINLRTEYDTDIGLTNHDVSVIDRYTTLINGGDSDVNVIDTKPVVFNKIERDEVIIEEFWSNLSFGIKQYDHHSSYNCGSSVTSVIQNDGIRTILLNTNGLGLNPGDVPGDYGWQDFRTNYIRSSCVLINPGTYSHIIQYYTLWKREIKFTKDIAGEAVVLPSVDGWKNLGPVTLNGEDYHKFGRVPYSGYITFQYSATTQDSGYSQRDISAFGTYVTLTRNRFFKDVIKYLAERIDPTIEFEDNETPSTTDSFYWLKTYEPTSGEFPFKYLTCGQISDVILNDQQLEKSNGATKFILRFNDLMKFVYEKFRLNWYLEDRSGTYYFIFKHDSEISYSQGAAAEHDQTNLLGHNWTINRGGIQYDDEYKYGRLKRKTIAFNTDHVGADIIVNSLQNIFHDTEIQLNNGFTDIWDILENPSRYPETDNSGFVLFSTDRSAGSELLTSITNQAGSYDVVVYGAGSLQLEVSSAPFPSARADSNDISGIPGSNKIKITLVASLTSGTMPGIRVVEQGGVTTDYTLSAGSNTIYHTLDEDFTSDQSFYVQFRNPSGQSTVFTCVSLSIKHVIYETRKVTGALTGEQQMNADLSIANMDVDAYLYQMPGKNLTVNGDVVNVDDSRLQTDRLYNEFITPIYQTEKIDFQKSIKTDAGQLVPDEVTISMKDDFATIKGRL